MAVSRLVTFNCYSLDARHPFLLAARPTRPCRVATSAGSLVISACSPPSAEKSGNIDEYQLKTDIKSIARSMLEGKPLLKKEDEEMRVEEARERFCGRLAVLGLGVGIQYLIPYLCANLPVCCILGRYKKTSLTDAVRCAILCSGSPVGRTHHRQRCCASAGSCSGRPPLGDRASLGSAGDCAAHFGPLSSQKAAGRGRRGSQEAAVRLARRCTGNAATSALYGTVEYNPMQTDSSLPYCERRPGLPK